MNIKKLLVIATVASLPVIGISSVYAQGGPRDGGAGRGAGNPDMAALIEEYTGLAQDEMRDELLDGATMADLIGEDDLDAFIEEAIALHEARIEERMATFEDDLRDRLTQPFEPGGRGGSGVGRGGMLGFGIGGGLLDEYTDLTPQEIREAMADGETLADIIGEGNVDALVADALANAEERFDDAVVAERLTEEEAMERLAMMEEHLTAMVNGEFVPGMGGFFDGRGPRDGEGRGPGGEGRGPRDGEGRGPQDGTGQGNGQPPADDAAEEDANA